MPGTANCDVSALKVIVPADYDGEIVVSESGDPDFENPSTITPDENDIYWIDTTTSGAEIFIKIEFSETDIYNSAEYINDIWAPD